MDQMLYNPQAMDQVGKLPLAMLWDGMDYLKQAQGQDQATLAEIMAQRQRAASQHKMQMDQGAATLEQTMLGNQQKQLDLQKNKALQQKTIDTELLKLGAEADEAEWKGFQTRVMQGVAQGNPKMIELYKQLPAIQEARLKHKQELEVVDRRNAGDLRVAQERNKGKASDFSFIPALMKVKDPVQALAKLNGEIARLQATEPDSPLLPQLQAMMPSYQQIAQEELDRKSADKWEQAPDGSWRPRPAVQLGGPAPNSPANRTPKPQQVFAKNPKTGERIVSNDGGKTWQAVK